jgi:dolichol-phosphate mannosyltransferase
MDRSDGRPDLSVLVPCYNERANVAPMVQRLDTALAGLAWEVIFIDDNSPDGTAAEARRLAALDPHVRCLRRIGRRGLASAVIEGALSSSATHVAVIDGDLQHDETILPAMVAKLKDGSADVVVGSRRVAGGDASGLAGGLRHSLSDLGGKLAQLVLPQKITDPMSGFFALRRDLFERIAPRLTGQGFKILVDLLMSGPRDLRVVELPYKFSERVAGESKLDALVLVQFGGQIFDNLTGGVLPLRFISFALVGLFGLAVHLTVLLTLRQAGVDFIASQTAATVVAMVVNFQLNNSLTYRTQRLRGAALWRGLILFLCVCSLGAAANIGIARALYTEHTGWSPAGAIGAIIGLVWNYTVSATLVWRRR